MSFQYHNSLGHPAVVLLAVKRDKSIRKFCFDCAKDHYGLVDEGRLLLSRDFTNLVIDVKKYCQTCNTNKKAQKRKIDDSNNPNFRSDSTTTTSFSSSNSRHRFESYIRSDYIFL